MATGTPTIRLPQPLYRRLQRLAALTRQPIERLVEQALSASLPPLADDVPLPMPDELPVP